MPAGCWGHSAHASPKQHSNAAISCVIGRSHMRWMPAAANLSHMVPSKLSNHELTTRKRFKRYSLGLSRSRGSREAVGGADADACCCLQPARRRCRRRHCVVAGEPPLQKAFVSAPRCRIVGRACATRVVAAADAHAKEAISVRNGLSIKTERSSWEACRDSAAAAATSSPAVRVTTATLPACSTHYTTLLDAALAPVAARHYGSCATLFNARNEIQRWCI